MIVTFSMEFQRVKQIITLGARRLAVICGYGCALLSPQAHAGEALIAAAANFQNALSELEAEFETETGHELEVAIGSTGKLYAQIRHGAPFDVFLAADQARPSLLIEQQRAVAGSQFTYAKGQLALWAPDGLRSGGEELLRRGQFRRLAIANPDLAPYGMAAREMLQALGLWTSLRGKLVMGENINQSYTFVSTGNAEAGFVAFSTLSKEQRDGNNYWLPDSDQYTPILQDGVLLNHAQDNAAAIAFLTYLKGEHAQHILARHGYMVD